MTRSTLKHITTLAAGLLLSGAAFSAVRAQDEAPPPPPPQGGPFAGPGDPNAPQGGPFGGGGGGGRRGGQFGGGQFPGVGNVALGTVSSVDAAGGKLTLNGRGGQTQTVQVSPATTIQEQVAGTIADLKVGDTVRVSGVPTALTAAQISTVPAGGANTPAPNPFGGNAARPGGGQFGGGAGGFGRPGGGQSTVTAKVATLSPLTLKMDDGTTVAVKADSTTKVMRTVTVGLSALKTGDQIVATGQTDANNQFTATALRVNMGGGGGFGGGRFGQGGFGGGQFGGGQGGGFGGNGQRGGNRRRGGQGGNGQGGPPPPGPDGQVGAGGMDTLINGE